MDDLTQAAERGGRLDELPEHEDDSDVATQAGGGVMSEGGTAEVRGTGELHGTAQAREPVADDVFEDATRDETPGIVDYTDTQEAFEDSVTPDFGTDPGDVGASGLRPPSLDR